ncbi:MAG TPA: FAD-binding oxidoreductase [Bauldia sp.]|nr:FAD-binding oxidoreductase [Bauldia sp.]
MERRTFLKAGLALAGSAAGAFLVRGAEAALSAGTASRLEALAKRLRGEVVFAGDPRYAMLGQPWNAEFAAVRPAAVVLAADENDVAAALALARDEGLPFVARNGGHSFAGFSATEGMVIDVRALNAVTVDPAAETATVGAGQTNLPLYEALWPHRKVVPAGTCPTVGVTGLVLGGGIGRLSPLYGLTSDNLLGVRMVTAEGRIMTANADEHPDLLWACRGGGGGNFGIVTELTFRLRPVDMPFTVTTYSFAWPSALKVLRAFQAWSANRPPGSHGDMQLVTGTPADGARIDVEISWAGEPERGRTIARDFVAATGADPVKTDEDTGAFLSTERDWICAGLRADECGFAGLTPNGKLNRYALSAKSDFVFAPWPDDGLAPLIEAIERRQADRALTPTDFHGDTDVGKVLIEVCGGAIDDTAPDATAFAHRGALYLTQYQSRWRPNAGAAVVEANVAWLREMYDAVAAHRSGASYVNYADADLTDWGRAYYGANLDRLRQIKGRIDPDNVFRFPQSIPPA